jgi:hypothetical protein
MSGQWTAQVMGVAQQGGPSQMPVGAPQGSVQQGLGGIDGLPATPSTQAVKAKQRASESAMPR